MVGGFHDLSWNLYRYSGRLLRAPRSASRACPTRPPPAQWGWDAPGDTATSVAARREPYRRRLTLDFAAGDAVVIPGYGGAQGIFFVTSDLLGDNLLFGSVSSYQGRRLGSILSNISATSVYLNQSRRVNWGSAPSAPRAATSRATGSSPTTRPPTAGSACCATRSAASPGSRPPSSSSTPTGWTSRCRSTSLAGSAGSRPTILSYVHDNSLWVPSGPIDGGRFAVTAGLSSDFSNSRFDSYLVSRRLAPVSPARPPEHLGASGLRLLQRRRSARAASTSAAPSASAAIPQFGYIVGSQAFMFNQEVRFPAAHPPHPRHALRRRRFPRDPGGLFTDVGKASFSTTTDRALLGSYGVSFRMALGPAGRPSPGRRPPLQQR